MLAQYHKRHKELERILECDMLFYCPCLRCGSDLISDEHRIGKAADGTDIFSGYYCKKVGRPPTYDFERLKEDKVYRSHRQAKGGLREGGISHAGSHKVGEGKSYHSGSDGSHEHNDRDQRR